MHGGGRRQMLPANRAVWHLLRGCPALALIGARSAVRAGDDALGRKASRDCHDRGRGNLQRKHSEVYVLARSRLESVAISIEKSDDARLNINYRYYQSHG